LSEATQLRHPEAYLETIRLRKENKGRGGKTVTVLEGFSRRSEEVEDLARRIKTALGVGGTVKDGLIEIQGDHRVKISAMLQGWGFSVKGV